MEKIVRAANGKPLAKVRYFTDELEGDLPKRIAAAVQFRSGIGYAGFKSRKFLKGHLDFSISRKASKRKRPPAMTAIHKEIAKSLRRCSYFIRPRPLHVFVFPTFNIFTIRKMDGVAGFTPWKNTMHIFFYPSKGWKRALRDTVAHESCHAISLNFVRRTRLLDDIVSEGLAEHFRERVLGGEKAPWVKGLDKKAARTLFEELRPRLHSGDLKIRTEVFYGTGKYPRWAGYAVGYNMVADFLARGNKHKWSLLVRMPADRILKKSGW